MTQSSKNNKFLIITGLSGSGKTIVSRFLEDFGYYCMDNIPSKLIPNFVNLWMRKEVQIEKAALVVDIREAGFTTEFLRVYKSIKNRVKPRLVFLEASNEALVKRFSESRRPHPVGGKSLLESVALEREKLREIKKMSDEVIDTTSMTISQLKKNFQHKFLKSRAQKMQIVVVSFGYKYGIPVDSDLVFDTRFLPNPFYIDDMRDKTGKSKAVRDYILRSEETKIFLEELTRFVEYLIPKFNEEGKSLVTISLGCTGGKHRSVVLADELKSHLGKSRNKVRIFHRDIFK